MRQYLGAVIFALLGSAVSIIGAATSWPWPWWVEVLVGLAFFVAAVLSYPARPHREPVAPPTAFILGDATGSTFGNVYSDADYLVHGDARRALFWNIIHRPRRPE